ncbi:MAG: CinA family nicotinamide mononucleotide deamidase-related protein [Elusimicrobia bacterium]|nr:CinA family nicotinamide mononucleotide deamidase-related protein [Elusimicrobiota bacterium]
MTAYCVELVHVGTELLTFKVNSHTIALAQLLAPLGLRVARACLAADKIEEIAGAVRLALSRSDLIIVTGGLGPTFDDVSREAAGLAVGRAMESKPEIAGKIAAKFHKACLKMPISNARQAMILKGAVVLDNNVGTAPGQFLDLGRKALLLLPGPPSEMKDTLRKALPLIRKKFSAEKLLMRSFRIAGHPESQVEEMAEPILRVFSDREVEKTILAAPYLIDLVFQARGRQARRVLPAISRMIKKVFGNDLLGDASETLENKTGRLLKKSNLTLALAESCTGGMIADRITDVPGSSAYFVEGIVAYSNEAKKRSLGVSQKTLQKFGAVSPETAARMAEGVLRKSGADYAVSTTGICGPGGAVKGKPAGLGYFGLARKNAKAAIFKKNFSGGRLTIKEKMTCFALDILRRDLSGRANDPR